MNKQGVAAYQAKDYEKALPFFREAALLGNMKAYRYLGLCYAYGCGQKRISSRHSTAIKKPQN